MTRIARTGLGTRLSLVLNGALWIGSKKKKTEGGSKEVGRGGGGGRKKFTKFCLQPLLHKFLTTKRTKKKTYAKNSVKKL